MLRSILFFCFAERGVGVPSRARVLWDWLTLGPIRRAIHGLGYSALSIGTPEWAQKAQAKVLVGSFGRISFFDWINPIRWIAWIFIFLMEWVATRRIYAFGPAVPAILLITLVSSILTLVALKRDAWRTTYYQQLLRSAAADSDTATISIALSRLLQREPSRADLRLQKALLHDKLGEQAEARTEMERLLLAYQHPAAALWIIQKDFRLASVASWNEKQHLAFRDLIQVSSNRQMPSISVPSRILFGQYLLAIGATSEAVSHMESVAEDNPELQLVCAAIHSQMKNEQACNAWAEKAQEGFRKQILDNPNNVEARLSLARAFMLQGQYEAMVRTLSDGYKLTQNERLRTAGAVALVAWAKKLEQQGSNDELLVKRLSILSRANELDPSNKTVAESLVETIIKCADNTQPEIEKLRSAIIGKLTPERAHFVQGTIAVLRGQLEQAEQHLKLAMNEKDNVPGIFNNLAYALSHQENADLDRALALVNIALRSSLNNAEIRETRGQILIKMKRYEDAVHDLEFALKGNVAAGPIHQSLAEAYEALGLSDLAKTHRQLAKDLTESK